MRGRVEPARLGKPPTAVSDCTAERMTASPVPAMSLVCLWMAADYSEN